MRNSGSLDDMADEVIEKIIRRRRFRKNIDRVVKNTKQLLKRKDFIYAGIVLGVVLFYSAGYVVGYNDRRREERYIERNSSAYRQNSPAISPVYSRDDEEY